MKTAYETRTVVVAVLPDYRLWQQQREECKTCKWFAHVQPTRMHCEHPAFHSIRRRLGGTRPVACIEARDPDRQCGPDGKLWERAE